MTACSPSAARAAFRGSPTRVCPRTRVSTPATPAARAAGAAGRHGALLPRRPCFPGGGGGAAREFATGGGLERRLGELPTPKPSAWRRRTAVVAAVSGSPRGSVSHPASSPTGVVQPTASPSATRTPPRPPPHRRQASGGREKSCSLRIRCCFGFHQPAGFRVASGFWPSPHR